MLRICTVIVIFLTGGCASQTYAKVNQSPLELDKAKCQYETDSITVQGRYTGLISGNSSIPGSISNQVFDSCMKAKGYEQR